MLNLVMFNFLDSFVWVIISYQCIHLKITSISCSSLTVGTKLKSSRIMAGLLFF